MVGNLVDIIFLFSYSNSPMSKVVTVISLVFKLAANFYSYFF